MDKFNFDRIIKKLEQSKSSLPKVLANETKKFFLASWQKQGWDDSGVKAWAPRKYNKNKRASGRSILVKSGALRRAVNASFKSATFDSIKFSVYLPYAQIHNEGGTINKKESNKTVGFRKKRGSDAMVFAKIGAKKKKATFVQDFKIGAHSINMPQRKYMGDSASLRKIQEKKIDSSIKNIWQA